MTDLTTRASMDQSRASDPDVSAWVSANAGSGKTHVLVNRVIRLMLTGTPPEKILCLTYTRAAAAEMSNRLYERLAEWIPLDDEALIDKIHRNTGHSKFDKNQLAVPRRLFAQALETPGGLKIQTIHAFCEQLLHRFPLEAGVTSGFAVMDDRQAKELVASIRSGFITETEQSDDVTMSGFIAEVMKFTGSQKTFDELLETLLHKRGDLDPVYASLEIAQQKLALTLGITVSNTSADIVTMAAEGINRPALEYAQEILAGRTVKTDTNQSALLSEILQSDSDTEIFEKLKELVLTGKGAVKSRRSLCTQKCAEENPEILLTLQEEADRIDTLVDKLKAIRILHATNAALHIGADITRRYEAEKNRLGFYDYHDLIAKVLSMFAEMPDAAWVLYKLDGGLDHILIDEAQDTSPAQWDIIQFLADDFFSGAGSRPDTNRSIFAVGDRKQSIYSFQGAAPESFDQRKQYFQHRAESSGQNFETVDFDVSFRSTNQVLSLVDSVFKQPVAAEGVNETVHSAQRAKEPGLVELWPLEEKTNKEKKSVWIPDDGEMSDDHSRIRLAQKIAAKIKTWLDTKEVLHSEKRPIKPGDILILVRRRTQLMAALVRALKQMGIPVAGVDRLKLTQHIGVQDLMALARFVLQPQDDLNFAGLLKSSLLEKNDGCPFDDEDLMSIALDRNGHSVWSAFLKNAKTDPNYSQARRYLEQWRKAAVDFLPFEFFSSILSADNKRKSILRRLGSEAKEPLDAFLLLTQEFEKSYVPSLQGLVSWIENGDAEIKREMEKNDNEVRIMTVHGAKGLESKIVILPDTYEVPDGKNIPKFLNVNDTTPVWRLKSDFETHLTSALKQQYLSETGQELNRLLYVAMTRACDRLYIGAAEANSKIKPNSWYQLVSNILRQPANERPDPVFGNVWRITEENIADEENPKPDVVGTKPICLPDWALSAPETTLHETNWVTASQWGQVESPADELYLSPLANLSENRFTRGNLIHKMLQYLPEILPDKQREVAERYITHHGGTLSAQQCIDTLDEIQTILTDKTFAAVFASNSIAEVPIVARITLDSGKLFTMNGQIDRLSISDDEILIVDYKTNRPPPANIDSVNPQYIRQLAAYRLALLEIYPNHTIRAGLLWTHNAILMDVGEKILIEAFSTRNAL